MRRILIFSFLMIVLFSCTEGDAYYPEIGIDFWLNNWVQHTTGTGAWTNIQIEYRVDNIGGVDLTDVRMHFAIIFTNAIETNMWGRYIDLDIGDSVSRTENFYFGDIGVDDVFIIGVGLDDPADDDDEEEEY